MAVVGQNSDGSAGRRANSETERDYSVIAWTWILPTAADAALALAALIIVSGFSVAIAAAIISRKIDP